MNKQMDQITNEFINKFIELERFITSVVLGKKEAELYLLKIGDYYDETKHIGFVHNLRTIKYGNYNITKIIKNGKWFDRLIKYSHIRNKLLHDYKGYLSISESALKELEEDLNVLKNPKKIGDIKTSYVFTCDKNNKLETILGKMKKHSYTHVPILDKNGFIVEVLNERSILYYILNNMKKTGGILLNDVKIGDINLKNDNDEYLIISKNTSIYDIEDLFLNAINQGKRLGVVLITNTGKANEKIEGIISSRDIPMIKKYLRF